MIDIIKKKLQEIGGEDTIRKAIVWDWAIRENIEDENDFKIALSKCKECYEKAEVLRKWLKGGRSENENSTNLFS